MNNIIIGGNCPPQISFLLYCPLSGRRSRILKKKVLFPAEETPGPVSTEVWSTEENKSLVELVLLHGDPQCGLVIA